MSSLTDETADFTIIELLKVNLIFQTDWKLSKLDQKLKINEQKMKMPECRCERHLGPPESFFRCFIATYPDNMRIMTDPSKRIYIDFLWSTKSRLSSTNRRSLCNELIHFLMSALHNHKEQNGYTTTVLMLWELTRSININSWFCSTLNPILAKLTPLFETKHQTTEQAHF